MLPRHCVPGYFHLVPTGPETVAAPLQVISIQSPRETSRQDFGQLSRVATITRPYATRAEAVR
jgi:hypothetical protein